MRRAAPLLLLASVLGAGVSMAPARAAPAAPALLQAAGRGDAAAVDTLLAAGADPNARGFGGRTALMAAAALGRHDIVRTLLIRGAARDTRDDAGRTAFDFAVERGQPDAIALLRDAS